MRESHSNGIIGFDFVAVDDNNNNDDDDNNSDDDVVVVGWYYKTNYGTDTMGMGTVHSRL